LALLQRWGEHATSFQILESGYVYWFDAEVEAVVAYVEVGRHRVVAGPPVTAPEHVGAVVGRFVADCRRARQRAVFFSADDVFVARLRESAAAPAFDQLYIGQQPEFDPDTWSWDGPEHRTLRAQCRRAERKVTVRRVAASVVSDVASAERRGMEAVIRAWKAHRHMGVMRFMVDVQPFAFTAERRYWVAERDGAIVALLVAVPVYQRQGWFLEDVIRRPVAPNGTAELLIHSALAEAQAQGDTYVTLGLAPLADVPAGPGPHRLWRGTFRLCARELGYLYGFEGLVRFKRRFRPHRWSAQYVVVSPPRVGLLAMGAVLEAFAGRSLVGFGVETARRLMPRVPRWFYPVLVLWATVVGAGGLALLHWLGGWPM